MTVSATLKTLITPLVTGGCHNRVNKSTTITTPYVVFYEVSGVPENGISGYLGLTRYRYQVDVIAKSQEQARSLALGTIKTAITTSATLRGELIFQSDGQYSPVDKSHQYITEYTIWAE